MTFSSDENFARQLDREDPLRNFGEKFSVPLGKDDKPVIYFAGNSLGLMPKSARQIVDDELDNWASLGVDAHHATGTPWYSYHEALREPTARLIGANSLEVICMNSLTVNLHLMMATFYRPTKSRFKILMEEPALPTQLRRSLFITDWIPGMRSFWRARAKANSPCARKTFSILSTSMLMTLQW